MNNPYLTTGLTAVSFSGGRTSGLMLRKIIDAHGGTLPDNVRVLFANTGKEREETLTFVHEIETRWNVPITWLEYVGKKVARVVTYETASRKGEPFERLIEHRKFLPNQAMRFCTSELKILTIERFLRWLGWSDELHMIGLRADEMKRVADTKTNAAKNDRRVLCPLAADGVTKSNVLAFFKTQSFDLQLKHYEGNCDMCFLKGWHKRLRIAEEHPDLIERGDDRERERSASFVSKPTPSYGRILESAQKQTRLPIIADWEADDTQSIDCACTD